MSLIPINIVIGNIIIKDINYEELSQIHILLNESNETSDILGKEDNFELDEIKERFLESLSSVSDFFLGIYLNENIIGIIKGRFENRSCTEVWFLTYMLSKDYRGRGVGSKILNNLENWFKDNYCICKFCVLSYEESTKSINFWNKNGYEFLRKTKIKHSVKSGAVIILEKKESM